MGVPEFATVAGITVICFLIGTAVKTSSIDDKYIPIIVGAIGGILGVVGMKVMSSFPAENIIDAIAVGIASGFSATGVHQIYKQLTKEE